MSQYRFLDWGFTRSRYHRNGSSRTHKEIKGPRHGCNLTVTPLLTSPSLRHSGGLWTTGQETTSSFHSPFPDSLPSTWSHFSVLFVRFLFVGPALRTSLPPTFRVTTTRAEVTTSRRTEPLWVRVHSNRTFKRSLWITGSVDTPERPRHSLRDRPRKETEQTREHPVI